MEEKGAGGAGAGATDTPAGAGALSLLGNTAVSSGLHCTVEMGLFILICTLNMENRVLMTLVNFSNMVFDIFLPYYFRSYCCCQSGGL